MTKKLLIFVLFLTFLNFYSQNVITEGFDDITTLTTSGWLQTNQSTTQGTNPLWFQGNSTAGGGPFDSYAGATTSYVACNYNSVTGTGTISNWLISPTLSLQNGDIISFYTRTVTGAAYPDRLQVRLSTAGSSSTIPSTGSADLGSFTTLLTDINSGLSTSGYPTTWTLYSLTVSGLGGTTDCKIAFRYFVSNGGPSGTNSDYIGVDSFSVDRSLAAESFTSKGFKVYPNPVTDFLQLDSEKEIVERIELIDINGRIVSTKKINSLNSNINISNLSSGAYLLNVYSSSGKSSTKILKQ